MSEKMLVTQALDERDLLVKKISDKIDNPYYTDPEAEDSNESDPAKQFPVSAEAYKPSSATGQVTEHTKTDSEGNTTSKTSLADQKKAAMQEADASEQTENNAEQSERGKRVLYHSDSKR